MAIILLFPTGSSPLRGKRRALPPEGGEILFFTGIRYERWDEGQPAAKPAKPAAYAARKTQRPRQQA